MVLHEADLLTEHLDLFLVLAEARLAHLNPILDTLAVPANVFFWRYGNLRSVLPEGATFASRTRTVTLHRLQHFNNL